MRQFLTTPNAAGAMRSFYSFAAGTGLIALLYGFGNCVFDMDQVATCAEYAVFVTDQFKTVGDYMIAWSIAFFDAVQQRV